MTNMSFNNFSKAIASIKESYDAGTLYKKTLVNGQLQRKSVTALIGATYKHFKLWCRNELKKDNEQRMEKLFYECVEELKKSATTESEMFTDIPSPYTLKITNYVINKLQIDNKISQEKIAFVNQVKETADLIAKNPLALSLSHVMQDPDWLAIDSIKDVRELYKKLENPYAKLTDKEIDLMKKCLRLAPKIIELEETFESDPQLATMVNNKEFSAIKKIAFRFADRTDYLRDEYWKVYGSVKMDESGHLIPTKNQLKGAFDLAFKKIPLLMEHRTDPEIRKLAARFVYTLMCDDEQIETVKLPDNDFSFSILEVSESENDRNYDIKDIPFGSYLELHLMTQAEKLGEVIEETFKSSPIIGHPYYIDVKNPQFAPLLFNFNQQPKETLVKVLDFVKISTSILTPKVRERLENEGKDFEKVDKTEIQKIEQQIKSEMKQKLKEFIENLKNEAIRELKDSMQRASIRKYLGNFLFDNIQRESAIILEGREYNLTKKGNLELFLAEFKENYYQLLLNNPQTLINTVEQNKRNQEATGINADMTSEEWRKDLSALRGNVMGDSISTIVKDTSFSEEQINKLHEVSGLSSKEIEPLLRVKMMQLMIIMNQSTVGLEPQSLKPSNPDNLQLRMITAYGSEVNCIPTKGFCMINPDFNGIKLEQGFNIAIPTYGPLDKVKIPTGFHEKHVTLGSLVKKVDIDQLLPTENQEPTEDQEPTENQRPTWGRLNESTNFTVSIDGAPSIDTLFNVVAEKK